jgi:hypothetical protein
VGLLPDEFGEGRLGGLNQDEKIHRIINNRAGGNAPLIAGEIAARLDSEKSQTTS